MESYKQPDLGVSLSQFKFQVRFVRVDREPGYAEYIFRVTAPNGMSFLIRDRYSKLLTFKNSIMHDLGRIPEFRRLPAFPKKTMKRSLQTRFLENRMYQLEVFFKAFFAINKVALHVDLMKYFVQSMHDMES